VLSVVVGQASIAAGRGPNQDFMGCATPEGASLRDKGMVFAVADGVGRNKGGRLAAETALRVVLSDYYNSPDTWAALKILEQILDHANASARIAGRGAATLAALVLRGRRYYVAHVGDARIYRLRGGTWTQLTEDHVWQHPDMRNVVSRAIGLDRHLHPEISQGELRAGDCFLLCTDGFYKSTDPLGIVPDALTPVDLQSVAEGLAKKAVGLDDVTVQLVRVETLPSSEAVDSRHDGEGLPFAENLREGLTLDDFYLSKRLHRGMQSEVYLAEDLRARRPVVLKFPLPPPQGGESETEASDRFLREEWLGRRVKSPHVLPVLPLETGRRSRLYYATPWEAGETLRRRLKDSGWLSAAEAVDMGAQLCRGLEALHRLQVLHRDIKPDNILLSERGRALLLDLGVARAGAFGDGTGDDKEGVAGESAGERPSRGAPGPVSPAEAVPGTPSYMAPEMFRGAVADERTEVYALGATLYEALTRKLPYGEIEPFSQPRFLRWTPPSRYNPDIPHWLETVLQKATEADPARRFQVLSEMQYCLDRREAVDAEPARRVSGQARRVPWKLLAVGFAAIAIVELVVLLNVLSTR
jgi:serine/threonine protein phosphatase PrpC